MTVDKNESTEAAPSTALTVADKEPIAALAVAPKKSAKARTGKRRRPGPAKKASHYVPHILGGLALGALHVWFDFLYQPVAISGMALCVYAYVQMGSVNEITSESAAENLKRRTPLIVFFIQQDCRQNSQKGNISITLGVVETIPYNELVFDGKPQVINRNFHLGPGRFVQERTDAQSSRFSGLK